METNVEHLELCREITDIENDKVSTPEQKDQCIICISSEATYSAYPCAHCILCLNCAIELVTKPEGLFPDCPLCRETVLKIRGKCQGPMCKGTASVKLETGKYPHCIMCDTFLRAPYKDRVNAPSAFRNYDEMFEYYKRCHFTYLDNDVIAKMIGVLSKQKTWETWYVMFKNLLNEAEYFNHNRYHKCMLSPIHANLILNTIQSDVKFNRSILFALVRMCSDPWTLPVNDNQNTRLRGFHEGICYCGNFGDKTEGFDAIKILKKNIEYSESLDQLMTKPC
jgi:hypothetical protein